MKLAHAIKWSFLSELASKAITPIVFVVLARLLSPEVFGVVAAATLVLSFSQVFWEAGLGKALIQYQGDKWAAANVAFWMNNALGILVAAGLILIAPVLAVHVFHDSRVTAVLQVLSVQVFFAAAASVHAALLQKDMRFKRLFWVRLLTVSAPGLVSIPLASLGGGYWALVVGTLVGQMIQTLVLWRMSEWRPQFTFDLAVARRLLRFGMWVAATGLLAWFFLWADSLVVGMYLGAHELGLYRTGNVLVIMVYSILFNALLPVLYSHFSKVQNDREHVRNMLMMVVRSITFVSLPLAFFLFAFSREIGTVFLGHQWDGVGIVIAMMAVMHGYAWIVGANGEAYRAIGRPDYETNIMAITLPVYLVAYWLSIQQGLTTFLSVRVLLALLAMGVHLWVAHVAIGLPVMRVLAYIFKVSMCGIPLLGLSYYMDVLEPWSAEFVIAAAFASACVVAYLWLIERRSLIPATLNLLKGRVGRSAG